MVRLPGGLLYMELSCAASKNMLLKCVYFCLCVSAAPFV